jgi:hypothetical protein
MPKIGLVSTTNSPVCHSVSAPIAAQVADVIATDETGNYERPEGRADTPPHPQMPDLSGQHHFPKKFFVFLVFFSPLLVADKRKTKENARSSGLRGVETRRLSDCMKAFATPTTAPHAAHAFAFVFGLDPFTTPRCFALKSGGCLMMRINSTPRRARPARPPPVGPRHGPPRAPAPAAVVGRSVHVACSRDP